MTRTPTKPPKMVWGLFGRPRRIVACDSATEAARLFTEQCGYKVSRYEVINYGSETGNDREVVVAMAMPRTVFYVDERKELFINAITHRRYSTTLAVVEV